MRLKLIILIVLSYAYLHAQNCTCEDNFAWLQKTMKENDAGYEYAIEVKSKAAFQTHTDSFTIKVKSIESEEECVNTMREWLRFFRKGHLWIALNEENNSYNQNGYDPKAIKKEFKDWERYEYNKAEFKYHLTTIKEPSAEGIWSSPPYVVGIKKVEDDYVGFIIEADGVYWTKEQVKLRIKEENGQLIADYYMQNHSLEVLDVEILSDNYMQIGNMTFKRNEPKFPMNADIDRHFTFLQSQTPLFEKISDETAILRIPSFSHSEKALIDSLIKSNWRTITSIENLIIDVRNNGGGSDISYLEIIPILYTNPIREVAVELYSTPLNNARMIEFMNDSLWSDEDKEWAKNAFDTLNNHLGEFVNLGTSDVQIDTLDTVYPYPRNVGIIVNGGCGSTTEQFILAAKQSKKVKLYGTTTFGSLDISNMHKAHSPCNTVSLGYCLSKSLRIPDMTIDGRGIQPDIYIDNSVPDYKWIEVVTESIEY